MRLPIACGLLLAALTLSPPAFAVGTSHWTQTSEADFKKGTMRNVVPTNLGELKLSRDLKSLLEQDPRISSVNALVEAPDGTVYAGTGPNGVLLSIRNDKVANVATLEDPSIFALAVDGNGRLLVGTGGEKGRVWRMDNGGAKPVEIFSSPDVQYVWAITRTADGMIYAATGPNGQLIQISPDGKSTVLFDSDENNLLCLESDGGDMLYAGSDPNGLVFRINRKTRDVFVLYDAAESEIVTLARDAAGNLYAGSAESSEAADGGSQEPASDKVGRPETPGSVVPLPAPPPVNPKPPVLPDPNPGEPDPIPKKQTGARSQHPFVDGTNLLSVTAPATLDTDDQAPRAPLPGSRPGKLSKPGPQPAQPGEPPLPRAGGNAIYRIDPRGFVVEVFRQPVLVMSIVENNGALLVGTGNEGVIYRIDPAAEETVALADADSAQIMALLPTRDGRVFVGMANVGAVAAMSSGVASQGAYTSAVLDAGQITHFGKMHLTGSLPKGTKLTVATRSSNRQEPADIGWSPWSDETPVVEFLQIPAPAARFLQYRLTFSSGDNKLTPMIDEIDVAHQVPNLAPAIKSVKIGDDSSGDAAPSPKPAAAANAPAGGTSRQPASRQQRTITWEASDPNNDPLEYVLYFRAYSRGQWIVLADKLKEPTYQWDTRSVADGRYELRVVASDARANVLGEGRTSGRVSDPIVIDNTPPVIGDLKVTAKPDGAVITAAIVDRTGTVAAIDYAVNSKDDWQAVMPSDMICDSPDEAVTIPIGSLSAGSHVVTVRATDAHGNQSYQNVTITVGGPASRPD